MSEVVSPAAAPLGTRYAATPKRIRKSPPPKFPYRVTICFDDEQIENLQQVKKAFRTTESFVLRMAFDTFCRTNGFPLKNGGLPNG